MKQYKITKIVTKSLIALSLVTILGTFFLLSPKYSADTISTDCPANIKSSDQSSIDFISENYSSRIKKGDNFIVLIQNVRNAFATTYTIDILKQNKSVLQKSGSLEGYTSLNNTAQINISTNSLEIADYVVKAKLYHKDKHCLLKMKTFNITITSTKDLSVIEGTELFDKGEVAISSPDNNKIIDAGSAFRATIENKISQDLRFELKVDNQSGTFLTKRAGELKGNTAISTLATITSAGKHIVEIDILNSAGDKILYTQRFNIQVNDSSAASPEKAETDKTGEAVITSSGGNTSGNGSATSTITEINPSSIDNIGQLFDRFLEFLEYTLGSIAFINLLISSIQYISAGGDSAKAEKAKKSVLYCIIGIILAVLSYAITKAIFGASTGLVN